MAAALVENFKSITSDVGMKSLEDHTLLNSYISGVTPSKDDVVVFAQLTSKPPTQEKFPNASRWFSHIASFNEYETSSWPKGEVLLKLEAAEKANQEADDDDIDLFGDDAEEVEKQAKQLAAEKAAAKKAVEAPKKKVVINKSSLVIEVKPAGIQTDLDAVAQMIKDIAMDGVSWGQAHKKVPLAFGLFKLQVSCTIVDDLVDTDSLMEAIEVLGLDEERAEEKRQKRQMGDDDDDDDDDEEEEDDDQTLVQSAEIVSFNKL